MSGISFTKKGKHKQLRHLAQSVRLEETVSPLVVRLTIFIIFIAIVIFLVWASYTTVEEIARAQGDIIPKGKPQIVQHLEGGIVSAIPVKNGDIVEKGQILLSLSDVGAQKDLKRIQQKLLSLKLQKIRFEALLGDSKPDYSAYEKTYPDLVLDQQQLYEGTVKAEEEERKILADQILQKKNAITILKSQLETTQSNHAIVKDLYDKRKKLQEEGVISEVRFLETKQRLNDLAGNLNNLKSQVEAAEFSRREFESRLETLNAKNRDEDMQKLESVRQELLETAEVADSIEDRVQRLDIKSPVKGIVKGFNINTLGGVIQPGETIMEILPLDAALVAQIKIAPDSIGYVKEGQRVKIKVSTYDFSRYGTLGGTLEFISATTFEDYDGSRFYQGRVLLDRNYVGTDQERRILPGMTVIADIITGEKTIMQYLLKPITVSLQTAFTER